MADEASSGKRREKGAYAVLLNPLFPPKQLRLMAYLSLAVAFGVFAFVLVAPLYLEIPTVRAVVCMMISLPISVFFFVFWPQKLETETVPLINLPTRIAGPVVLWFIVLAILLFVMPQEDRPGRLFLVQPTHPQDHVRFHRDTVIRRKETGEPLQYYLIEKKDMNTHLEAVYLEFKPGEETISAEMTIPGRQSVEVTFHRKSRMITVPPIRLEGE